MSSNQNSANNTFLPELLAPCGSPEALAAAISAGADAVYFGGRQFNARMNAVNFDRTATAEAIARCHAEGVRAYVTFNTLIYDREMREALEYAAFLWSAGADALIVADLGLASRLHTFLPELPLHASTQATVHNRLPAKALRNLGFTRVVLARELCRADLAEAVGDGLESEVFVQGALCAGCSGQCLMSALIGGRSGNRGECAQPCRMSYNGGYPLSLRELCLAEHIPELIDMKITSLKLEGRMRSPAYVGGVTGIYRRLLDERRSATRAELDALDALFSRSGHTDGYFTGRRGASMTGVRTESDKESSRAAARADTVRVGADRPRLPAITVSCRDSEIRLPDCRVPTGAPLAGKAVSTAFFSSPDRIPETDYFKHVYVPLSVWRPGVADGAVLPAVIFPHEIDGVRRALHAAASAGLKRLMVNGLSQLPFAEELGLPICGSFRLNIFNSSAARFYADSCSLLDSVILSPELSLPQLRDIACPVRKGAIVYGRIPVMLPGNPVGKSQLRDRRGAAFPVVKEDGSEVILNSVPTYTADMADRLDAAGIAERHFIFHTEDRGEALRIIYAYSHSAPPAGAFRRIGVQKPNKAGSGGYTRNNGG